MQRSDYDRVRNIPFRHGRRLDPLFMSPFPLPFFREHRFIRRRRHGNVSGAGSSASTCCHAKCNAHAMQKRATAVILFASTRASIPPDKGINRITSKGERISASEMGCARARAGTVSASRHKIRSRTEMNSSFICRFPSRIKYYKLLRTIFCCIQEQSGAMLFSSAQRMRKLI